MFYPLSVSVSLCVASLSFFVSLLYYNCASLSIDRLHNLCVLFLCIVLLSVVSLSVCCVSVCCAVPLSLCVSLCVTCASACLCAPLCLACGSPQRLRRVIGQVSYCLSFCVPDLLLLSASGSFTLSEHLFVEGVSLC